VPTASSITQSKNSINFSGFVFGTILCQDAHWETSRKQCRAFWNVILEFFKIMRFVFQNALQILLLYKVASRYITIYWRFLCTLGMVYLWLGQTPSSGLLGLFQTKLVAKFSMI
jgi:hypothetical protein